MLAACVVYWVGEAIFFGTNPFASLATASFVPQFKDMADTTLFKFVFQGFHQYWMVYSNFTHHHILYHRYV